MLTQAELNRMSTDNLWDVLKRVEETGRTYKAALDKGQEFYRQPLEQQRATWKAIKAEIGSRTQKTGLAAAAAPVAAAGPVQVTPKEFHRQCAQHDWHHGYSDDPGAYRAGRDNADRLASITHAQPELAPILKAWQAHVAGDGPKPVEPKE